MRDARGASHGRLPTCGPGRLGPAFRLGNTSVRGAGGCDDSKTTNSSTPRRERILTLTLASRGFLAPQRVISTTPAALGIGQARLECACSSCSNVTRKETFGVPKIAIVVHPQSKDRACSGEAPMETNFPVRAFAAGVGASSPPNSICSTESQPACPTVPGPNLRERISLLWGVGFLEEAVVCPGAAAATPLCKTRMNSQRLMRRMNTTYSVRHSHPDP